MDIKKNIEQIVYIPLRNSEKISSNITKKGDRVNLIYSNVFNNIDRLFYHYKLNKILTDIKSKIDFKKIDIIHAHFLFSMGGIALELKKEYQVDYVVSVRNSDLNLFFRFMPYLRKKGIKIMMEARRIIFISPAYKEHLINNYIPIEMRNYINHKTTVIPNGISSFWLQNKHINSNFDPKMNINLIYVGEFTKNKNIVTSIRVTRILKKLGYNAKFIIIGGRGEYENKIKKLARKNKDIIDIYDRVKDKEKLLYMYRDGDIFIMPSFYETFGLVYLEAMSQGLPIIYTKGQGIDGYFENGKIGYSVNPRDVADIVKKIKLILQNYKEISSNCYNFIDNFSWNNIADMFFNSYQNTSNE